MAFISHPLIYIVALTMDALFLIGLSIVVTRWLRGGLLGKGSMRVLRRPRIGVKEPLIALIGALTQRRLYSIDRVRWSIHTMIFWPSILIILFHPFPALLVRYDLLSEGVYRSLSPATSLLGGIVLMATLSSLIRRLRDRDSPSSFYDYAMMMAIMAILVSGFYALAMESGLIPFLIHFTMAFVALAYLPWGKLLHMVATPIGMLNSKFRESLPLYERILTMGRTDLDACTRCNLCMEWCDTYAKTKDPGNVVLGMIQAFRSGTKIANGTFYCTLCSLCEVACPAEIRTHDLILSMRGVLAGKGLLPNGILRLRDAIEGYQNIFALPNEGREGWMGFLDEPPEVNKKGSRVLYYVGCLSSFSPAAQNIAISMAKILKRAGLDFTIMGGDEYCCGFPLLAAGLLEEARELMKHNIEKVRGIGADVMVFACPSCYYVWKSIYAQELDGTKMLHSTQLLSGLIRDGRIRLKRLDETVTYHDPCDLGRNMGIYDEPREVITPIVGRGLVEMKRSKERASCCGGGGDLEATDPGLTSKIGEERVREAEEAGASLLVSACPQCRRILSTASKTLGSSLRVMDITELMASAMGE